MAWVSIASGYELFGEDGTRAVVGNSDTAMADADWVALLDPESGIQGLLDTAAVRASKTDLVEADGVSMGPSFQSGRSGTVNGFFNPNLDVITISNQEARLKRATRALRGDGIMRWTPYNDSSPRQIRFRRQDGPRISGRRPKTFQVTLDSPDVYALASSETSVVITPGAAAGETGITSPITNPITTALNVTAQQFVVNAGDAPTWPRFRVDGPITNPQILRRGGATATNLVTNPSFEIDTTGWAQNAATGSFARVAGGAVGGWSLQQTNPGTNAGEGSRTTSFDVAPSLMYAAGFWVKGAVGGEAVRVTIKERDAADALIGQTQTNVIATTSWAFYTVARAFGATGVKARVSVESGSATAATFFVDGAILVQDTSVSSYFDGDTPGSSWNGAAHASTSSRGQSQQQIALAASLAAGEWLDIIPERGRILLNGTGDRYSYLDFAQSDWFKLEAGSNDIRLLASSYSSPAQLTVRFNAAWE